VRLVAVYGLRNAVFLKRRSLQLNWYMDNVLVHFAYGVVFVDVYPPCMITYCKLVLELY